MKCFLAAGTAVALAIALCCVPVSAQGEATVLVPITPPEIRPWNAQALIAANAAGEVLVAFPAERERANVAWSSRLSGGSWSDGPIPLPPGDEHWTNHELRELAAGPDGRFVLLFKNQHNLFYYAIWSGSAWQTPVPIPSATLESPDGICFDAAGNVLLWDANVPGYFGRHAGGQWQSIRLAQRTEGLAASARNELMLGRDGAVHLVGVSLRRVPTVASCPAGADPLQPQNWVFQPTADNQHTSPIYSGVNQVELALDWPRQTLWATWFAGTRAMFVSHAPIGATSAEQWMTWEVAHEDHQTVNKHLVSSGAGAVGVAYTLRDRQGRQQLVFRWLPPTGLGQPLQIARPGSQTEAADFSTLYNGTLVACVGRDGNAHIVIKGRKRGEYPENAERLYYSRVSGGAVLQTEPAVDGGETIIAEGDTQTDDPQQDWREAGGRPNFVPVLGFSRIHPYVRDGEEVYRFGHANRTFQPEVAIRNIGSQYFGDLEIDLIVDGAVIRYVRHDDSGHMRPLIERDGTLHVRNMPSFRYEYTNPDQPWSPPSLEFADNQRPSTIEMRSGLGRKTMTLIVDPRNLIEEETKENNTIEVAFEICDGREAEDRLALRDIRGNRLNSGHNDLAILGNPRLHANTLISAPGLIQAPTELRMIVGNPRGATFFRDVDVVALLDGDEIYRETIPLIDGERRLFNTQTEMFGYTAPPRRTGAEVRGGFIDVPVDLTNVEIGDHTLTLIVDPEDRFADVDRDNNIATIPLRVRERGGRLIVLARDYETGGEIPRAHVHLSNLFFGVADERGAMFIDDVPAGDYDMRDLWVRRPYPDPRYTEHCAPAPFTVRNNETTEVTVRLERPLTVNLTVLDDVTGEVVDAPPAASLQWTDMRTRWTPTGSGEVSGWRQGAGRLLFSGVRPGQCTIKATAYAYLETEMQADLRRDARGECHVEIRLPRAPRGTVEGIVVDQNGRPVRDISVQIHGVPRYSSTDANGHFSIAEVGAGRPCTVVAWGENYTEARAATAAVPAGGSVSVNLQVNRIVRRTAQLGFDAITRAQLESWPGFSFGPVSSDSYEVSAQHGMFNATVGARWHEIAGANRVVVDEVVLATKGGLFWESSVSYTYSLGSIINAGITKALGETIGQLCKLASPINDVYAYFRGDIDTQQLHGGEVVGTYSSWTGTRHTSTKLISIPGITYAPTMGGGQTVVRCDMVEITDGQTSQIIRQQWYSPAMMVYSFSEEMNLDTLEIRFYVQVMNERLDVGPLYNMSRNVIIWRPTEPNWLRFEPRQYDALGF